jgi:hypothetical protein
MLSKAVIVAIALYLSCRIMRRHTHDDRACVRWTPDRDFRPRKARWNFEVDFYSLNIKNEEIHSRVRRLAELTGSQTAAVDDAVRHRLASSATAGAAIVPTSCTTGSRVVATPGRAPTST